MFECLLDKNGNAVPDCEANRNKAGAVIVTYTSNGYEKSRRPAADVVEAEIVKEKPAPKKPAPKKPAAKKKVAAKKKADEPAKELSVDEQMDHLLDEL